MGYIEFTAVLFSLWSVWLAVKKNKHTWSIGLLGIMAYMVVFWQQKLYVNFGLQFIFIGQSIWGYLQWEHGFGYTGVKFKWSKMLFICSPLYLFLYSFFLNYTDNPQPLLDSTVSVLSIIALYLMMVGNPNNWLIWGFTNSLYVVLFIRQGMTASATLYIILLYLSIKGYKEWKSTRQG